MNDHEQSQLNPSNSSSSSIPSAGWTGQVYEGNKTPPSWMSGQGHDAGPKGFQQESQDDEDSTRVAIRAGMEAVIEHPEVRESFRQELLLHLKQMVKTSVFWFMTAVVLAIGYLFFTLIGPFVWLIVGLLFLVGLVLFAQERNLYEKYKEQLYKDQQPSA